MWNEEIEKAVLFYVIYEQEALVLNEDDFVSDRNRKIVRAINELKSRNEEISIFSISSRIKANKKGNSRLGLPFLIFSSKLFLTF